MKETKSIEDEQVFEVLCRLDGKKVLKCEEEGGCSQESSGKSKKVFQSRNSETYVNPCNYHVGYYTRVGWKIVELE